MLTTIPPSAFDMSVDALACRFQEGLEAMRHDVRVPDADNLIKELPRRKAADTTKASLASALAKRLYSHDEDREESLGPLIRYEKDLVQLRAYLKAQQETDLEQARAANDLTWPTRIAKSGPWNQDEDPLPLTGAPSLPMPVTISDADSLKPFFHHLRNNGGHTHLSPDQQNIAQIGAEPYYGTRLLEFPKGVLYEDGRMDLCKMVVGPTHINGLMDSLETNDFTQHYLLGNNIIGPFGAKRIAAFIDKYPNRMQTWYLAGNCIDAPSFHHLTNSLIKSTSVTNVWLKRNPLTPAAANDLFRLITETPNLRTLDLDQTELGDEGVAALFDQLADYCQANLSIKIALRHVYMNGIGIGAKAAAAVARYLSCENCTLTSLYASNNPAGNRGALALARGLKHNASLERLVLGSCGIQSAGARAIFEALRISSPGIPLRVLDLGQNYATDDLGMKYNWIADDAAPDLIALIKSSSTTTTSSSSSSCSPTPLRYISLDLVPMSQETINQITQAVLDSAEASSSSSSSPDSNNNMNNNNNKTMNLLHYKILPLSSASSPKDTASPREARIAAQEAARMEPLLRARLRRNLAVECNDDENEINEFGPNGRRFLLGPRDVRLIDSVYRNRDAGLARRGLKVLDKWWAEGDRTLGMVQRGGEELVG